MELTVGFISSWIFSIFFLLGGIGMLVSGAFTSGFIFVALGVFLLPRTRIYISEEHDITFSRWIVVGITTVAFIVGGATIPEDVGDGENSAPSDNGVAEIYERTPESIIMQDDDLDTEWQYEDIQVSENGSLASREAIKVGTAAAHTITNTVHVFDSQEEAQQAYENEVNPVKEQRGYEELDRSFGQDEFGEESFAYRPSQTRMLGHVYFHDQNVFVEIELASGSEFNLETNTLLNLAESIEERLQS